MMKRILIVTAFLLILSAGCQKRLNPETGQKEYRIDPNVAQKVEEGTQAGIGILTILAAFWPALIPAMTAAAGVYGTWLKVKPRVTKYQQESQAYHTAGSVTAAGIEQFKKLYPKEWENLCQQLEKVKNKFVKSEDQVKIENIIRGFRGLPPIL